MLKILFINNNLEMGGIQKALINMLKNISGKYDITLMLFSETGTMLNEVPKEIKVVSPNKYYRILGIGKEELKHTPILFVIKAFFVILSRVIGKRRALKLFGIFQKKISGFDVVISCSHLTNYYRFENGCAEFVLDKSLTKKKICFVHCDYKESGFSSIHNNEAYLQYDRIICVSESVKNRLLTEIPELNKKVCTIRNFYDFDIKERALEEPYIYNEKFLNIIIVARLSPEKGIARAIEALKKSCRRDILLHIVGDGPSEHELKELTKKSEIENQIIFYGKQENPYRYMARADYLLLPSFHEAAPIVYDEAHILNIPIISTMLLSSKEMLNQNDIICENTEEGLINTFNAISKKEFYVRNYISNDIQIELFRKIVEG